MGEAKEIKKDISGTSSFLLSGLPEVEFIKSDANEIVISGVQEELDKVGVKIEKDILDISYRDANSKIRPQVHVKIYTQRIDVLQASSIGSVKIPDIINPSVNKISLSAIASVDINMNVTKIDCSISSVASVNLKGACENGTISLMAIAFLDTSGFKRGSAEIRSTAIAGQR